MRKIPARTYIAAMDYLRLEKALGSCDDFWVIGSGSAGDAVLREIDSLEPDLLILEGNLAGMDGLKLLGILGDTMTAPPRALYLGRDEWIEKAREAGADFAFPENEKDTSLLNAVRQALDTMKTTPRLAKRWEKERLNIAGALLNELSIPDTLKGKAYARFSCAALACAPQLGQSFSSRLYPLTAKEYHTTAQAVERAVRTAVEYTWLYGDLNAIQRLFGFSVDAERGKPTNAEFLFMLAEHVKRDTAKKMGKENEICC